MRGFSRPVRRHSSSRDMLMHELEHVLMAEEPPNRKRLRRSQSARRTKERAPERQPDTLSSEYRRRCRWTITGWGRTSTLIGFGPTTIRVMATLQRLRQPRTTCYAFRPRDILRSFHSSTTKRCSRASSRHSMTSRLNACHPLLTTRPHQFFCTELIGAQVAEFI